MKNTAVAFWYTVYCIKQFKMADSSYRPTDDVDVKTHYSLSNDMKRLVVVRCSFSRFTLFSELLACGEIDFKTVDTIWWLQHDLVCV